MTDKLKLTVYIKKIENKITFKTKTVYCLGLLMSETKKSLASSKNKVTKNKNGENVSNLEITKVVLVS